MARLLSKMEGIKCNLQNLGTQKPHIYAACGKWRFLFRLKLPIYY